MSLRQAINDMCKYCIYDKVGKGNWREQVQMCPSPACPLFDVRPKAEMGDLQAQKLRLWMTSDNVPENVIDAALGAQNGLNGAGADEVST